MPDIYSNVWNVVAWLGLDEEVVKRAFSLIPRILSLKIIDAVLGDKKPKEDLLHP